MKNLSLLLKDLKKHDLHFRQNEKLADYTTIRVGGKAKIFIEVVKIAELELAIRLAYAYNIPYRILGKGSNIIVSDSGYDGLVILNNTKNWQILTMTSKKRDNDIPARFNTSQAEISSDIIFSYRENQKESVVVRVDSGIRIGHLLNVLFKEGITGLQWFAGIPGTIGGAIYMNIHGGDYYFGDLVIKVKLTDGSTSREVDHDYFNFNYDWSILHRTGEVILSADLSLNKGNVEKAKELAKSWMSYKSKQPRRSAGCIFQNLSLEEQNKFNLPTPSAGYIIDHILQLKGTRVGDALISPAHAAFIENSGNATARDVIELINLIKQRAKEKLGLQLKLEVELIGDI